MQVWFTQKRTAWFVLAFAVLTTIHLLSLRGYAPQSFDSEFTPSTETPSALIFTLGWQLSSKGLTAPEGVNSLLALRFRKSRFEEFFLEVEPTESGRGKSEVHIYVSPRYRTSPQNIPAGGAADPPWHLMLLGKTGLVDAASLVADGGEVNVSTVWTDGGECEVYVRPRAGASGPLVRSLHVRRSLWKWSMLLVPLLSLAVLSAAFSWQFAARPAAGAAVVVAAVCAAFAVGALVSPVGLLDYGVEIVAVSALLAAVPALVRERRVTWGMLVVTLVFLGAWSRFDALIEQRFQPLEPDAASFHEISQSATYFYDSQHREPLFPFLLKVFLMCAGDGPTQVRLFSFIASVLLVPLTFLAGAELRGRLTGLIAAALIAGNDQWALHAVRGLRLEVFTASVLIVTMAVFTRRELSVRRHVIWLGLSSAAMCLLRVTSLWLCLLGAAYALWRRGWSTRAYLSTAASIGLPIVPYSVYCANTYGDPFYAVNLHVKFYRNQEFKGQPGMPTHEMVEADPYAGPDVTASEFFFGMHTVTELARRTVRQLERMFFGRQLLELMSNNSRALAWWAVAGYAVVAALSRQRMLLVWMLLTVGPATWLFADQSEPEWRLVFHASALVYLSMGLAVEELRDRRERSKAE